MTPRGYRRVRLAWRSPPTTSSGDRPYRHDDVDLPGADVLQQSLQIGTVGRPTGVSPIVIAGPDQGPSGMGLGKYSASKNPVPGGQGSRRTCGFCRTGANSAAQAKWGFWAV